MANLDEDTRFHNDIRQFLTEFGTEDDVACGGGNWNSVFVVGVPAAVVVDWFKDRGWFADIDQQGNPAVWYGDPPYWLYFEEPNNADHQHEPR